MCYYSIEVVVGIGQGIYEVRNMICMMIYNLLKEIRKNYLSLLLFVFLVNVYEQINIR